MKVNLPMPIRGLSRAFSVDRAEPSFSDNMNNVWPQDAGESRVRLSKRPGLSKWSDDQIGGVDQPVVLLADVSVTT